MHGIRATFRPARALIASASRAYPGLTRELRRLR
jgi:hypothetical protein